MKKELHCDVCVVGLGPAGLGAALTLARRDGLQRKLICVDQGSVSEKRVCGLMTGKSCCSQTVCPMVSGIGGCSLTGGGKISDYPAGSGLEKILGQEETPEITAKSINLLREFLPLEKENVTSEQVEVAKKYYQDLGFEYRYFDVYRFTQADMKKACRQMCAELTANGANFLFETQLDKIENIGSELLLYLKSHEDDIAIHADSVILAVGRSGRSLLKRLNLDLGFGAVEGKIDVGVRLDFPSSFLINKLQEHQDLKLIFDESRTFCVCQGGRIVVYQIDGALFTEGSCDPSLKPERTNLAILRRFKPTGANYRLLEEIKTQSTVQRDGKIVHQTLHEYLRENNGSAVKHEFRSLGSKIFRGKIDNSFPKTMAEPIREAVRYFADRIFPKNNWDEIDVFAPEVDYAGITFPVKNDFAVQRGIYLVGDCTGHFRGIAQAFASGIACAERLK